VRDRLSVLLLGSARMFHERSAWSNRTVIRAPIVVDQQLQRWSRWRGVGVCGVLGAVDLLESQLPPLGLSGLSGQECNGSFALAFATFVAMRIMVEHDQIEGLLGDLAFATLAIGAHEPIDHLDQRGGPDNGVQLVEHQGLEGIQFLMQAPSGARQPQLARSVMIALGMGVRLVEEMIMVPRQHETIHDSVRHHSTECSINRLGVLQGDDNSIDMRAHGRACGGNGGAAECFHHVEKQRECCAYVFPGAQSAMRRAEVSGFTKSVEQHGQLVVTGDGLLTGVLCCCIVLETLCQIGRACGRGKLVRRVICLLNRRIGFALQLMLHFKKVAKRVEIIRHPYGHVVRGPVAGYEAPAPGRGHAQAGEMVRFQCCNMPSPGVSRAIWRQRSFEDRGAARVTGDQNGRMEGKNLIAQMKHKAL